VRWKILKAKSKVIIAGVIILLAIGGLIATGVANTASYYMTVDEFMEKKETLSNRTVKLSGFIIGDSVIYDEQNLKLRFEIRDEEETTRLWVVYEGVKPDMFTDGWEAIVDGQLNKEGVFIASELLVKCPSKYEEQENLLESDKPYYEYQEKKQNER
jgi:cytochrome c-type biogenesis protein CcmE